MARTNTITLLPLDTFAAIIGLHPLHFNQVSVDFIADPKVCDMPLVQYSWQDADRIGREEIAEAIATAENMIAEQTCFKLLPTWEIETINVTRPARPELFNISMNDVRGFPSTIRTKWKQVLGGGVKVKSLISAGAGIVYSDADADTYNETATITVATAVTNPEEIAIYYPGKGGDEAYEIRPITVSIVAGTATITCRREQLVNLALMEALEVNGVDGLINTNFLTTVDVYRKYNDVSTQALLLWMENSGNTYASQDGCFFIENGKLGLVRPFPATWDSVNNTFVSANQSFSRRPDKISLYYMAGWRYGTSLINMDPVWQRVISYLTLSILDRPLCACKAIDAQAEHWREDLAESVAGSHSYRFPPKIFDNPFGTTRGAIFAWRQVQKYLGDVVDA